MVMDVKTSSEIWPEDFSGLKYDAVVLTLSSLFFYLCGEVALRLRPRRADGQTWRWKNISISFLHSVISGISAVLCFYERPEMAEDLIKVHTPSGETLIAVSVGYFVYDTIDMLIYQRTRSSYELIGHHAVIIVCFSIAIVTNLYVGYAVVALLVELNNIFLHIRQLLQICGFSKKDNIYRINSVINLATFVGCRIATLAWMTRWLVINKDLVPFVFYACGSIGMAIMTVMNIILFYRLIYSDFLRKKERTSKED